ncbi:MAG: hypothetical protein LBO78_03490 [Rickettsiales bacterium]|jgi:palmitoyl transferase|nr:hypothetical protein [Rickettsiales bacterium]
MKKIVLAMSFISAASPAAAGMPDIFSAWWGNVEDTWENPDSYDAYIPVWTWHNRAAYPPHKYNRYNEEPVGAGFGLTKVKGDVEHSLHMTVFKDSNYYTQGAWGYARTDNLWLFSRSLHFGYGFVISAQMRHEYNYVPIPIPLPMLNMGYKNVFVEAVYVPGWREFGNVMFMWVKIKL